MKKPELLIPAGNLSFILKSFLSNANALRSISRPL